jgi:WD40 repeat protein
LCPAGWATGPDDGYFFQNLPRHLVAAASQPELLELLTDPAWLEAKLAVAGPSLLAADCDLVPGLGSLREAIELSAGVLLRDPGQLANQLRGRLDIQLEPTLRSLLTKLAPSGEVWLRPVRATLASVGQPLIRTLEGHHHVVLDVAMSPEEGHVASASMDGTAAVWDLRTGDSVRLESTEGGWWSHAAWTRDGKHVITGGTAGLTAWDPIEGTLQRYLHASLRAVVLAADGRGVVAGDGDGNVVLWDHLTGHLIWTTGAHRAAVSALTMTSGGLVISGAEDGTVTLLRSTGTYVGRLGVSLPSATYNEFPTPDGSVVVIRKGGRWEVSDAATHKHLGTLPGHTRQVTAIVVTGGNRAATSSFDGTVRVWDIVSGEELHVFQHSDSIHDLALVPPDRVISAAADGTLQIWSITTGQPERTLSGHTADVLRVVVSFDGTTAVSASSDHTLRIWDLVDGDERLVLRNHTDSVRAVAVSMSGRYAVSASNDATVRCWRIDRKVAAGSEAPTGRVNAVAITPDGRLAISGSGTQSYPVQPDPTVRLWDAVTGDQLATLGSHTELVTTVAITIDGRRAVTGSEDGGIKVWDLLGRRLLHDTDGHTKRIEDIQISSDGRRAFSAGWDNIVRIWNLDDGSLIGELRGHAECVTRVRPLPGDRELVSTSRDGTIRLWDVTSERLVTTWQSSGSAMYALALEPTGSTVISGNAEGTIEVWEKRSQRPIRVIAAHSSPVTDIVVSDDGSQFVSASGFGDATVRVWSLDGTPRALMQGHSAYVVRVVTLPSGRVVSSSLDGTVRVWAMDSGRQLAMFRAESAVYGLAAHANGTVVVGEEAGRVHVLKVEPGRATVRQRQSRRNRAHRGR